MRYSNNKIELNGNWYIDYLGSESYKSEEMPIFEGFYTRSIVPAYWEDMIDEFRKTKLHTKLAYNPLYTLQRYPQAGYVPDMALPNIIGSFGYKREFRIDDIPASGSAYLYVGGAQSALSAWINGTFIGRHEGYSSEFSLKIDKSLLNIGANEIVLAVSNTRLEGYDERPVSGCTSRAANECTGGIYGDVEIRFAPTDVTALRASTSPDLSSFSIITIGSSNADYTISILDGNKVILSAEKKEGETVATFSTDGLKLWSPEAPFRYTARYEACGSAIEFKFGIRRLTVDGIHLKFNGEPFMFRAICEHGYYPLTVHPPKDKGYYRAVIRRLKELGFNAIRFHTWVPTVEYLEAAEELGILIEVETPNNTTSAEWCDIVNYTSQFTSPVMYSSGNEMVIDENYIEHLRACASLVHANTDSLFSPMSAMRGIEYHSWGDCKVEEPFPHNPKRLETIGEFCDVYNSYSRGGTSYRSDGGTAEYLERCNAIYGKPLLSHEICINGTYIDLSLVSRYEGTRIGDTELFSSVERHLREKGLLSRAPLYYKNSVEWQKRTRKHCFELCRRIDTFAGYDFLGDIDHHWHTFGYCVGMMNEFYELKGSETLENVRRYNSDVVLLADLPRCVSFEMGKKLSIPLLVSNYAKTLDKATLAIHLIADGKVIISREIRCKDIPAGAITSLYNFEFVMPKFDTPKALKLSVALSGGEIYQNNEWEIYAFPKAKPILPTKKSERAGGLIVRDDISGDELLALMKEGKSVLLFSAGPLARLNNTFQISLAGRTEGHLATVIADHPLMSEFPHDGFCGWQFREMMTGSHAVSLDLPGADFAPIVEIASAYKNARREALLAEYKIGNGRLFISTLNYPEHDPAAMWLKAKILDYCQSDEFAPACSLTLSELSALASSAPIEDGGNTNIAQNLNDITMRVKKS